MGAYQEGVLCGCAFLSTGLFPVPFGNAIACVNAMATDRRSLQCCHLYTGPSLQGNGVRLA